MAGVAAQRFSQLTMRNDGGIAIRTAFAKRATVCFATYDERKSPNPLVDGHRSEARRAILQAVQPPVAMIDPDGVDPCGRTTGMASRNHALHIQQRHHRHPCRSQPGLRSDGAQELPRSRPVDVPRPRVEFREVERPEPAGGQAVTPCATGEVRTQEFVVCRLWPIREMHGVKLLAPCLPSLPDRSNRVSRAVTP